MDDRTDAPSGHFTTQPVGNPQRGAASPAADLTVTAELPPAPPAAPSSAVSPAPSAASPAPSATSPAPSAASPTPSQASPAPSSAPAKPVGHVVAVDGARIRGLVSRPRPGDNPGVGRFRGLQIGGMIRVDTPRSAVYAIVSSLATEDREGHSAAGGVRVLGAEMIGEIPHSTEPGARARFQRGVGNYPELDAPITVATPEELARVYARPTVSTFRVGTVHPISGLPAYLATDDLLGKHFAIVGSTGSGKSCSSSLILRAILGDHPNSHVVLLDPHNEYFRVFGDRADVLNPDCLQLPYWLLNFEEIVEVMIGHGRPDTENQAAILRAAILHAKRKFIGDPKEWSHVTVDTPVPYNLSELVSNIDTQMGQLDKPENSAPFLRLKTRIESLRGDRRYGFMFSGLVVEDALPRILSQLLSIPVDNKPVTIVDLSGVPSEIVNVVVSVMCRMIFDFALWSVPAKAQPVLLVCEEAHRYVPEDSEAGFEPAKRALSRIAMEGRKYGVSLCLVSQRPSELSPSVLSQCATLFALRMSNERDQEIIRRALPEASQGLLGALPSLRTQEAVVVGEGVSLPMRLRFDNLAEENRPMSGNADFSERWQHQEQDERFVRATVERWRMQER